MGKKRQPSDPGPEEPQSDFAGKPAPQPEKGAAAALPRIYAWRGWTIAEWQTKKPGERGHLLFRRKERAEAFLELIKKGDSKAAFRLALGRMRPDWNVAAHEESRED